jgi:threonine dehydrogenase-like Zn-dependent dehydrogenase
MYAPGDVRVEQRDKPTILKPTDAIIKVSAACVCGSDLWPWRGIEPVTGATPMGHEYVGIVEQVGDDVTTIKPGQFVVGSFMTSDNTCEICQAGYQSRCAHVEFIIDETGGAQAGTCACPGPTAPWSPPPRSPRTI